MTERTRPVSRRDVRPITDHDAEIVCGTPFVVEDGRYVRPAVTKQDLALFRGLDDCYTLK
ncbi:MAG TPA: hypothetical protein VHD38_03020 [Candidatus Paceibacterota bacterium]|nr:hypothetical protein [Candidatus Paceibacterota bacterium]